MKTGWLFLSVAGSPSTPGTDATVEWWRLIILAGIFAVLFGVWWYVNRGQLNLRTLLKTPNQIIKVEEQKWLNAHFSIVLVQVGEERFLLAQNQHGVAWQKVAAPRTSTDNSSMPLKS